MLGTKFVIIFVVLATVTTIIAHSHEPPHLKYTREINEAAQREMYDNHHSGGHHIRENGIHGQNHGHSHSHIDCHEHSILNKAKGQLQKEQKSEYIFDENGMFSFLNDPKVRLWVFSMGSTLLISAFPCLILAFIPIKANANEDSTLLKLLLAFGAGGLLGDAFLHLIPHAMPSPKMDVHAHSHLHGDHGHSHEPHDMSVGQWVLTGFMVFFVVEKFVRILRGEDSHSHSHKPDEKKYKKKSKESDDSDEDEADYSLKKTNTVQISEPHVVPKIRVAAYLNLVADLMHNFTDGLAIGASFIAGSTVGLVTMITVLAHEIPHEIGDFAILVQSGCSKGKAMLIQLCTAGGALLGCAISLWSVDAYALAEAAEQSWVLPFTAGGFIYIATVSVIPELLEKSTFWQSSREVCAIVFGVFLMYLIAYYE